ncbi:uncharacterized protein PHALS_12491 [Plasmopara halstedii]|uniref:Uncharacterized protein n=1 Tax=Plasmopara halstedii TaxID=4781 RepID=A0A0P1ALL6_PLAHL|nr:uncharacterized protein PHALS_12491 [Plasmopara halstedii]CEG42197.1 hypothetical protein PHALS_12491 [Plasmopara halstedii]|eukprot:XP_024578566.1 hypothetical protein PHALS_12491 [Plasmopara halstedii]
MRFLKGVNALALTRKLRGADHLKASHRRTHIKDTLGLSNFTPANICSVDEANMAQSTPSPPW